MRPAVSNTHSAWIRLDGTQPPASAGAGVAMLWPARSPALLRDASVAEGVSLKEIADHLGHVSLAATQMYAKVDLTALSEVGAFPLSGLVEFALNSERAATPIQMRGSMEALRGVAAIGLGGLL